MLHFIFNYQFFATFLDFFSKAIAEIAITTWEAIQKRSHTPMYKTDTKKLSEDKSDTFFIVNYIRVIKIRMGRHHLCYVKG